MAKSRPPLAGLVWLASAFPGLRAALRRFTPGYCSIGASGAQYKGYEIWAEAVKEPLASPLKQR